MAYEPQEWEDGVSGGTPINAARLNHMEAGIAAAGEGRGSIDHGEVAGALTINADLYMFHEMELTGDITLTFSGAVGKDVALMINGTGNITLANATWDTEQTTAPGTMVLMRAFTSGWRAFNVPVGIRLVPAGVTFTEGSNTINKADALEVGINYLVDDVVLAFDGDHVGFPEGLVNVTAEAQEGYQIAIGSTVEWSHEFGPLDALPISPDDVTSATLGLWYDASVAGNLTLVSGKVDTWKNTATNPAGDANNRQQTTDANRPTTTTINGKTAVIAADNTKSLNKTSQTVAGLGSLPISIFGVVRIDSNAAQRTVLGGSLNLIRHTTDGKIQMPGASPSLIEVTAAYTLGQVIVLVGIYKQSPGVSKIQVGDTFTEGTLTHDGGLSHVFGNGFTGVECEQAIFDGELSLEDIAGLVAYARDKWGAV